MRNLIHILFCSCIFSFAFSQEAYNNCANALELCPNKTFSLNNIGSNATVCPNCEDDFNFCFTGENSIWLTFTTKEDGDQVNINFSNLIFQQGNELQAAIIEATLPCIPSSYQLISNCESGSTGNFTLSANNLQPSTTYYIVVNGKKNGNVNAEATFDLQISGDAVDRNPQFIIGGGQTTVCNGNTVTFYANIKGCDDQSIINWYVNDSLVGSSVDTIYTYVGIRDQDIVTAKVSCFDLCRDTLTSSNFLPYTVHTFEVDAGSDRYIRLGESVQLNGHSDVHNIIWEPSSNMNDPTSLNPVVQPSETTTYYLTGSDGTCSITDQMTVFVDNTLEIPNTFSPNGDGINDTWEILGIENYPDCSIQVFSRWGQLVFQTTGYPQEKRWDGTSRSGAELTEGAYFYVINLRDSTIDEPIKGTVSIVR